MKKLSAILMSAVMLVVLAVPAFAVDGYTESVTAKPAPGVVGEAEGIVITPYVDRDQLDDEAKKELEDVFAKIEDGTMTYPAAITDVLGTNPVVKDLFDITVADDELQAQLDNGTPVKFTLDANLGADEEFMIASFVDGQWVPADSAVNNGDGTITVEMSKFCPVAIFVKGEESQPVGGEEEPGEDGVCIVCHGFFPYLSKAPLFDGMCIICFVLIATVGGGAGYTGYRKLSKKEEKK